MGIRIVLTHLTLYRYERPITIGPQMVRLRPAPHSKTPILSYALKVQPAQHHISWQQDIYNNYVSRLVFQEKSAELSVEVSIVAELSAANPFDFFLEPGSENFPFRYSPETARDLAPYLVTEQQGQLLQSFLNSVSRVQRPTTSFLVDLNSAVQRKIGYVVRMEPGIQTPEQTLAAQRGSCRDSAWLLVQVLRHLGFASRFVSGYLIQLKSEDPDSVIQDSAELHAWAEVFLPGAGWIGLDPTSGLFTGEGHIPLACTPDTPNASAITGTVEPSRVDFSYSMTVHRVNEPHLHTGTISDEQWKHAEAVAHQVDRDLAAQDVRLTMGGEPTFVGLDEPDSPQWNGDAMGPLKRNLGVALIRRMRDHIAPGALLHFGQGKWYPGEALPRWAMSAYWRADGVMVWENTALIAEADRNYEFGTEQAFKFAEALTRRLQVSSANILPAYEDTFYYLWKERRLPVNVDAADSKLANPREREELARVFERGLTNPSGYVLPIRRRQHEGKIYWSSQPWFVRPDRLLLVEGDSPIGYRLPFDSLPWIAPDDIEYDFEDDPLAKREKLPPKPARQLNLFNAAPPAEDPLPAKPVTGESAKGSIRPALCIEARQGRMHVFLPYLPKLPDYLDLLAAIEDTAAYLQMPIWVEGYPPPRDPRLLSFSITPDPGVLEVNLPPARNWDELNRLHHLVFEEARRNRLTAEKLLYNGKHTSTGGGNHIVLGGPTADDSPLLRRPDLLRSLLAFWQNHPSLSYLFSGDFIGPTSQFPRVDEARMDSLYELEIAFSQLPATDCPPWLVDRLFRNLLIDVTGNTHRAEFCIDKLYPPEESGLRLGLLELRAFEMAPNVRMEMMELLLIRALVAMFWKRPYEGKLVRWGTALHDRFMLPHYVKQDLTDVLGVLQRFGYHMKDDWYAPQLEFRFPTVGSVSADGVELEIRQALEPWHVLGEQASGGGMARPVDSSLERIQVKLSGQTESRYVVGCNGRRVPLRATGKPGESVAGVRYRAWRPALCLHPTIPVQSPLAFTIYDLWNQRAIAGCSYSASGEIYKTRPADAGEAASRRAARFAAQPQATNATPEFHVPVEEEPNPSLPMTLDLRWPAPS